MDKDALRDKTIRSKSAEYSVHNLIGAGRFSRVYRATDTATGNAVVIKVLNSVNMEEHLRCSLYMQELSLLNRLKSSPVRERYVDLRDVIQLNTGVICFVMEMLGATLHAVMCNVGTLPLSVCRLIVRQIAQGLAGLKVMGIVHADLKPDNIMFCPGTVNNHRVKIIDFGWAFYAKDAHTMYNQKIQAIPYRASEVCFRGNLGHGLDLWSLGCIMPEIITGAKLFDATKEEQLVKLFIRTLDVPDFLISITEKQKVREEIKPSVGWIRFQDFKMGTYDRLRDPQKTKDIAWFVDLVYKMLKVMPYDRITAADALSHPFLTMLHFIDYPHTAMTRRNMEIMKKCALQEI